MEQSPNTLQFSSASGIDAPVRPKKSSDYVYQIAIMAAALLLLLTAAI